MKNRNEYTWILSLLIVTVFLSGCQNPPDKKRQTLSLNGNWQIAITEKDAVMPAEFPSSIRVPGLIDMASPALELQDTAYENSLYWYRRSFRVEEAENIQLKINKAKYHCRVFVNGNFVGENLYCFTPGYFNIKPFLVKEGENELVVSVGCENNMPDTVMTGHDFEKKKYIPGIYDDVKIIASGSPHITNIQVVPNIQEDKVRIVARIEKSDKEESTELNYRILETATYNLVGKGIISSEEKGAHVLIDFEASMENVKLWTPETPFLYTLELETRGDSYRTRFAMRSFTANPDGGPYLLNGKPYYLRGTNVCILRFFEDPDREALPWENDWSVKVHERFKEMNWNSIRYCIGFPPERWYEIADSLGFLIQDEYPVWTLFDHEKIYPDVNAEHLAAEYRSWLRERWNHPSVVIWDAQNESVTEVTGEAIKLVRPMDLSERLWENGWSAPDGPEDPIESHPYLFSAYMHSSVPSEKGPLSDLLNEVHFPANSANDRDPPKEGERHPNPLIINEYAWLWLNRDGSTTTLTDRVYDVCFGEDLATEDRISMYMKHLGILSEYWRAHRHCAGVLHFCGLGYSRPEEPRGQTSDHFIDIAKLTYEPKFVEYVKPAFSPVGLMINFWENSLKGGREHDFELISINDLESKYTGELTLTLQRGDQELASGKRDLEIPPYGRSTVQMTLKSPEEQGKYKLIAEILVNGESVKSIRVFEIK